MTCWLYGSRATSIGVFCAISAFSRARPIDEPPEHRHYAQGIGAKESEQRLDQQVRLDERLIEIHDEGPFDVRWLETDYRLAAGAGNLVHEEPTSLVVSPRGSARKEAGKSLHPCAVRGPLAFCLSPSGALHSSQVEAPGVYPSKAKMCFGHKKEYLAKLFW